MIQRALAKLPNGMKFMLTMVAIYIVLFFIDPSLAGVATHTFVQDFIGLLPMLVFAFFIIFIVNLFLKPETIKRHLGHESGYRGWMYVCLGSILISAPPYILFPMLKELREHGMKYGLIALFMNNRNVQPAFLPVMVYYFGMSLTIIVSVYILIFAFINAFIIGKFMETRPQAQIATD